MHADSLAVLDLVRSKTTSDQKVVFVSGNFNVVHPGHLRLLRLAAECGDFLVVGVCDHNPSIHLLHENLRLESVQSISFVSHAFILRDQVEDFIRELKPAVVVKGKEHEDQINPEQAIIESYGGKLLFGSGDMHFSSLEILRKEVLELNLSSIVKPSDFPKRHGFTHSDVVDTLKKFKGLRITVLGDLIVDEYLTCDPLGMSQEDPTIVVTPVAQEKFVGGAGIVAAHAKGLGAQVQFLTVTGKDETAAFAKQKLADFGVENTFFEDDSRPTTLKQRFRASGKTLLRVSHLRQHDIAKDLTRKMVGTIKDKLAQTDLLIFSDFNYGCLPQNLVDNIVTFCRQKGIMMVADSQSSSQVGDVSRFRGMSLITPTEREARLAVRDFTSGLVVLAESLRKKSSAQNVFITLGAEGLLIYAGPNKEEMRTDRLPAFNTSPRDPAGAGDSLLIGAALATTVGASVWIGAYLGSIAAACQVGRVGNLPLKPSDIQAELNA